MVSEEKLLYFSDKIMNLCTRKELRRFDGFVPIEPDLYHEDDIFFIDADTNALNEHVNIAVYVPGNPDGKTAASRAGQITKLKKLSHKEMRKRTGAFAMNPYQFEVCFDDWPKISDAFLREVNGRFKYFEVGGYKTEPHMRDEILANAQVSLGVQFYIENCMGYVYLRPENAEFGFRYPLENLQQVKELFSLRDIPDGYKRRAALRHWVARHFRRKLSKPGEFAEVRKHLRGREEFDWFGIKGEIVVNQ